LIRETILGSYEGREKQMFDESVLEKMIIDSLVENGWRYIAPADMPRSSSDVMVESMVKSALIRLNPEIAENPDRADEVIYKLRGLILSVQAQSLVTQNERFKKLVFEENSFPFGKNGRMVPIRFFGSISNASLDQNEYVVTNQWVFPKEDAKRLDLVLLINGFPVAIGELKTPVRKSITWLDGANDIAAYEKSIPQMFVTNVFNFASEGKAYRYGAVGAPADIWGPWHTPKKKTEGSLADVKRSIQAMIKPEIVMDLLQFFTLFATDKKHRKYKIISRYQQYEGANLIVERVKAGYPKKGLIWHFQGSGKSLLMVFAAQKLRMTPELGNPTVVIVDDRIDLETQITATFNASDIPNLESAESKEALINFFKGDTRKILITTIFKFGEVGEALNHRDNIILLVDEAHRTQEGDLGMKMRRALPNAFFFGLTGTPINRADLNTFRTFGAEEDRTGYLSRYSFSESIRDNATLPLHFETVPVELHINQEVIDSAFDEMTADLSTGERTELAKRVKLEAIMKSPDRIKKVCAHIAKHFTEKIEPNGFKGQVVCYDRECCLLYKEELDKILGEEKSTIVMDTNNDKEDRYKAFRRSRDEEARLLDEYRDPANPLKLVIVTSKLLTGFDAPVLQAMYLDKPMRDHTLLQAICRTNRLHGQTKTHGLIVDYIGIFDDVARALNFDDGIIRTVITDIEEVKDKFPALFANCMSYFHDVDRTLEGWEGLMAAQERLPTSNEKDEFGTRYKALNRAWEALSPDPFLAPYQKDYVWLTQVYESVKPTNKTGGLIWAALGAKTIELVHQNVTVEGVREDVDILSLDPEIIDKFIEGKKDPNKLRIRIEISLVARIQKHSSDPKFVKLGERLEKLREQHEQGLIASIEFLKALLVLAKEAVEAEKEVVPAEEIDKGKAALTELFAGVKNVNTPVIVERIVADIDDIVKVVRFEGWQDTSAGRKEVKRALRGVVWLKYKIKDQEVFDKAYKYLEAYY
jgi:type I restriction enzyme R subunit